MFSISSILPSYSFTFLLLSIVLFLVLFLFFYLKKTEYLIYTLLVWFPIETLVLRWTPPEFYALVKYFPEVFIYSIFLISWVKYIRKTGRFFPHTPINKFIVFILLIAVVSLVVNNYDPLIWGLGIRQTMRFILIFMIFLFQDYSKTVVKNFLWIGAVILLAEALLAIVQFGTGGALDKYLFFTDTISVGNAIELEGIQQDWAPGQRVYATLGRYDRLGSLLAIGLVMLYPWIYGLTNRNHKERWWAAFAVGTIALVLTYSRASWIAFLSGIFTIAFFLLKDKKLIRWGLIFLGFIGMYLLFVVVTQNLGAGTLDQTGRQSLRDRVVEAVSPYSWKQSYEGYGRFFFIYNTPLMVVRYYPLFGVGPGNYGGGVAAALSNNRIYERLHLPFGIQNTWGQVDNNWLSIWGELGTFGLIAWILLFREIYRSAYFVQHRSNDLIQKTVAEGVCGTVVAICVLGFFGPYFEFRSLMLYFWLLVAIALYFFRENKFSWNFLREQYEA